MRIAFFCKNDFNLGAAYVIAYLKSQNHEVRLFLNNNENTSVKRQLFSPDLICFSCVTANIEWGIEYAKKIREETKTPILFGGVHPTLCPETITREGFEVCVGDGISHFGGTFAPDSLWPDREIFFRQLPPVHRAYQIFMTGFGCPFKCSYCNSQNLHRKLIRRTVDGCIKELIYLKSRGLKYVLFVDDVFTVNKSWLVNFLEDYRNHIGLPYTCFGHTNIIDDDICKLLRYSKCETVWLGVQSGSERVRKEILNRHETNEQIQRACRLIKNNKLKLMIDHIFDLPFETYETLLESFNFYKTLNPDVVNCYELLYFPKAEINKFGKSNAKYETEGGRNYNKYAKSFVSIPFMVSKGNNLLAV